RHTRLVSDWSSDVCSSDLIAPPLLALGAATALWCASAAGRAAPAPANTAPAPPAAADPVSPDARRWLEALTSSDPREVELAVKAITALPDSRADADLLLAAGRACEDKLLDPERAVAIYDRIVERYPDAHAATPA